jgi:uncharacterized protein YigA (DUF484 family)
VGLLSSTTTVNVPENLTINIHLNLPTDALAKVSRQLERLIEQGDVMHEQIEALLAEATRGNTIANSVLALVQTLADAAHGDMTKFQEALDVVKANHDKLQEALVANTPQE